MNQNAASLLKKLRSNKWTSDYAEGVAQLNKLTKPRKRTKKKTWKQKGWYSPMEPFGPRSEDC